MPKPVPSHADGLDKLKAVVHDLRSPGGCPWDREQTHRSLTANMLEEAYEAVEAIHNDDDAHLCEELGDVLLQVALHSEIASESGAFDLDRVAHAIADKLIRRHPHVYGESSAADSAAVLLQWDEIKKGERGAQKEPYLSGISHGLPALTRAVKLQKRAAKVGFDWPDAAGVIEKLREEIGEAEAEMRDGVGEGLAEEIGDILFSAANLARKLHLDPESLLAAANTKFTERFHLMERLLEEEGVPLGQASLDQMEAAWQAAKRRLSSASS
jgi:MazG family protein